MAIDATSACAAIPEVWRVPALKALFAKQVAKPRILSVTEDISNMGDILHVKINPKPTVGNITAATGAYTAEDVSITDVTLTVDKWKYVAHDVVEIAQFQANIDLVENFIQAFVPALGEQIDIDIFGLYSSMTANGTVGDATTGSIMGDDVILPGQLNLDNLDIELENRSIFVPPAARGQLYKQDKFVNADTTGEAKSLRTTGFTGRIDVYGNPVYLSTKIQSVVNGPNTIFKAIMAHRDGMMVGIQKNIQVRRFAPTKFSIPFAASVLYGVAICRNNHNQVMNIKSTLT